MGVDRSLVVEGPTIEEAIKKGLNRLKVKRDDVQIEILSEEQKGILGFGKKEAKVKLMSMNIIDEDETLKSKVNKTDNEDTNFSQENELLQIEGNRLILKELEVKKYPVVSSGNNVQLYKKGGEVVQQVIVTEDDDISFEVINEEPISGIRVRVSDDKLRVFLEVERIDGVKFTPKVIKSSEKYEDFVIIGDRDDIVEAQKVKVSDLYAKLDDLGIIYGINAKKLVEAIENPNEEILVAQGEEPQEGEDASIEYLFNDIKKSEVDKEDKVDYFSLNQVYSVNPGEVIAIKKDLKEGEAGVDVYGKKIEVELAVDVDWKIGEGVKLIKNKAVATKPGRPILKNGILEVMEIYHVLGDVDKSVGNIDFNGDVIINRNVQDHFKVNSGGKISVKGNVSQAHLEGDDQILVSGNIIGSKIISGRLASYYKNAQINFKKLRKLLENLKSAVLQLEGHSAFKTSDLNKYGYRQIIQLLLDGKFNEIVHLLNKIHSESEAVSLSNLFDEIANLIRKFKDLINEKGYCNINNLSDLDKLLEEINMILEIIGQSNYNENDIVAKYVQNSTLIASGSIIVEGKGVYNSNLYAGGKVEIKGFYRGGKIEANENVYIKEIGSLGGSLVQIFIPEDKRLIADKVYSNVEVHFAKKRYKFQKDTQRVSCHMNEEGKIKIF
ncbi:flagellar assembly protein A [Halonatronum saccharophilum]|uniref:flagellar assembly protein A n=1 Tax=Halonatronum saccharophilum TaxID=150060 RepID=UPI0004826636|nr:FapA family protein [Halonatronum saccharophilum]